MRLFGKSSDSIHPRDLKKLLDENVDIQLIDVRFPHEYSYCHIPSAKLIPLPQLPYRARELDKKKLTVVYCHHGVRSKYAVKFLKSIGFVKVKNLVGGIDAWSRKIDPQIPRY